jgi:hypothetical protein
MLFGCQTDLARRWSYPSQGEPPHTKIGKPGSIIPLGNGLFGGFQGHFGNSRLCHFCKTWNQVVQVAAYRGPHGPQPTLDP